MFGQAFKLIRLNVLLPENFSADALERRGTKASQTNFPPETWAPFQSLNTDLIIPIRNAVEPLSRKAAKFFKTKTAIRLTPRLRPLFHIKP